MPTNVIQVKSKKINPSLKWGEVLDNRYKVESFKTINEWTGGNGLVKDLKDIKKQFKFYFS